MKKILSFLLVAAISLALCACNSGSTGETVSEPDPLQVGFSRVNITPIQLGVQIAGGDASARLSKGALDELTVTCIALSKGDQTFLVFTMDLLHLNQSALDVIKPQIASQTGIPPENILLNCTHTHSSVNILSVSWDGSTAYRESVAKKSADAALAALADLSPAEISIGSTNTQGLAFVRHYLMNDGTTYGNGHGSNASGYKEHLYEAANELQAIKFTRAAEDKKDIVLISFPAHATTVSDNKSKYLSACWPRAARSHVEKNGDVLCAVFAGASGDQVPDSKIVGLSAAKRDYRWYGRILGNYVLNLTYTPVASSEVVLKSWQYSGRSMREGVMDTALMAAATEIKNLGSQYGSSSSQVKAALARYPEYFCSYYEASGLVDRKNAPAIRIMTLNVLQLGSDAAMVFAPYEMFGMHGEAIKTGSPYAMDFIVTNSEVYMGYMPHIQGCEEGFYEYDVTKFERGTGETLVTEYINALTELKTGA